MQHALCMGRGQPGADLCANLRRLVGRKAPDPTQQRGQVLPIDELHREERARLSKPNPPAAAAGRLEEPDIVHAADVGLGDLPGDAHLADEPLAARRRGGDLRRHELQRDRLPERQVVGAVDLPHAPAPDPRHDPVAPRHDGAGNELGRIGRGGAVNRTCCRGGDRRRQSRSLVKRRLLQRSPAPGAERRTRSRGRRAARAGGHRRKAYTPPACGSGRPLWAA